MDAIIDQWELRPGDDLPHFMETHLADSDYVVMVCTDEYVEKANAGSGGVGYEKMIVTADLLSNIDSNKVIPIIRQFGTRDVPTFLKTKLFINFSSDDDFEFSFDELVRNFHNALLYKKPDVGNNPFKSIKESPPEKRGDALRKIMKIVVSDFERGENWTNYSSLVERSSIFRIMLDIYIEEAVSTGLIRLDHEGDLFLESAGKKYAVQYSLVKA